MKTKPTIKVEVRGATGTQIHWTFTRKSARHLARRLAAPGRQIWIEDELVWEDPALTEIRTATAQRAQLMQPPYGGSAAIYQ